MKKLLLLLMFIPSIALAEHAYVTEKNYQYVLIDGVPNRPIDLPKGTQYNLPDNQTMIEFDTKEEQQEVIGVDTPEQISAKLPINIFNVDQFKQDLYQEFSQDIEMIPYYAVIIDLATYKNFDGLKQTIGGLVAYEKITQEQADRLLKVLSKQGIE